MRRLVLLACLLPAIGCRHNPLPLGPTSPQFPTIRVCTSVNGLPDPICTPGKVRTTDVQSICDGGSTRQYRPPASYTNALKKQGIVNYQYADTRMSAYEEDHLISLEVGGDGSDPNNLWPEPHTGPNNSFDKDRVENWLHKQICSGTMTPQAAQSGIATDWRQFLAAAQANRRQHQPRFRESTGASALFE